MSNYWTLVLSSRSLAESQVPVAEYVVETDQKSVEKDLAGGFTLLQKHLRHSQGIDARDYVQKQPKMAETLLAALIAMSDCIHRFNVSLPNDPPPVVACAGPGKDFQPVASVFSDVAGAKLWVRITPTAKSPG